MEDPKEKLASGETPITQNPEDTEASRIEKRDFSELRDHLKSLIERIGGLQNVTIVSKVSVADRLAPLTVGGEIEGWWSQEIIDPKTRKSKGWKIHVPERILESSENVALGSAAHEAGHVAISRAHRFIPDRVMQEPGFHQLITSVEELPVDQVVRERYPGAGRWVDETRDEHGRSTRIFIKTEKDFGYIPKSIRLNQMIIHGRRIQDEPETEPYYADIKEIYERIKNPVSRVEYSLPDEERGEDEVISKAKERYKITYKEIWPEAKKLVEEDLEKEKLRQMLEQAAKQAEREKKEKEKAEKGNGGDETEPEESPSDEQKEIADALKQMSEEVLAEMNQAIEEALRDRDKAKNENESAKDDPGKTGMSQEPEETEEGVPIRSETEEDAEEQSGHLPIPMDKLSERLIKALQKAFEKLPKHIQEKLNEMARKAFEEMEDEFVKEYGSELVESGEIHDEYQKRKEDEETERQKEERRSRAVRITEDELKDTERQIAAVHKSRELYDQVYEEIRELDDELYRELEETFTPNIKRTVRLRSSGSKINLPAVFRWESGRKGGAAKPDDRIFEQVHLPEKKDYAITLLNDLSGSMEGEKIYQDFRAKILLAEVLNRLGVKNEILGFQDKVIIFKRFDEEINDDIRRKMNGIMLEPSDENPGGNNRCEVNYDALCLLEASKGLEQVPAKEKFLIVISDGQPTGPSYNPARELTEAVNKILTNTNQKLVGLGLGPETEHVKKFYPTSIPNITVKELTETLGGLLKDMIVNPQKYKYTKEG